MPSNKRFINRNRNAKIAICATKGGVGKTTLTANLGGIIATRRNRVLLVDADPQPAYSGGNETLILTNETQWYRYFPNECVSLSE